MTNITCPVCKSLVERSAVLGEFQPVEYDERGLPWACALSEGFGLPIWQSIGVAVKVNGKLVEHAVAYDRRAGVVWAYQADSKGRVLISDLKDDIFSYERHEGEVTVDWHKARCRD